MITTSVSELKRVVSTSLLIMVATALVLIIFMFLPLPTFFIDCLIGVSVVLAVIFFVFSVSSKQKDNLDQLSVFLIVVMIYRLALAGTIVRFNLLKGDSGWVTERLGFWSQYLGWQVIAGLALMLLAIMILACLKTFMRMSQFNNKNGMHMLALLVIEEFLLLVLFGINYVYGSKIGMEVGLTQAQASSIYSILSIGSAWVHQIPILVMCVSLVIRLKRPPSSLSCA